METTPDVPENVQQKLKRDAAVYGHGVAYLVEGRWVALDPKRLVIMPYEPEKPKDSVGYASPHLCNANW